MNFKIHLSMDTNTRKSDGALSYASDSKSVITVDKGGKAHIVGTGIAKLTIAAAQTDNYKGAAVEVPVTARGYTIGSGFDISLYKQIDEGEVIYLGQKSLWAFLVL